MNKFEKTETYFVLYLPRAFYKKNLDQFVRVRHRTISYILYLNHNWKETDGSQLRIYVENENGIEIFFDVIPAIGIFACFKSDKNLLQGSCPELEIGKS